MQIVNKWVWILLAIISICLFWFSLKKWIPIGVTEILGFITGAICVLLVINQSIWNFPIGIANNIFLIILFLSSRLYGDMALQGIYIFLGFMGWWQWLFGGKNRTVLQVNKATARELLILTGIGTVATIGLREYFIKIGDAAPFLDAVTTVLSLIAQFQLNGKRIESWYVWIIADIIYVGLYIQKDLYLTAVLYAVFIGMCIMGLLSWRKAQVKIQTEVALS
jgi:nicotinamide mononucleotide transporter